MDLWFLAESTGPGATKTPFPRVGAHIIARDTRSTQFRAEFSSACWLLNEYYTSKYAEIPETPFESLHTSTEKLRATATIIHLVEAVFTILFQGRLQNTLWFGCPTHAKLILLLLLSRLMEDGEKLTSGPLSRALHYIGSIRAAYFEARRVIHNASHKHTDRSVAHPFVRRIAAFKRSTKTVGVKWAIAKFFPIQKPSTS